MNDRKIPEFPHCEETTTIEILYSFLQDYFQGISISLHYLFISSLCCQLNMPAALYAELSWKYCQKEFKAFLISKSKKRKKICKHGRWFSFFFFLVFSLILPAFYSGIAIHYELPRDGLAQKYEDFWFVKWPDSQFNVLLTMNLILVISYLILTAYLMKMLRSKALVRKNPHER